MAKGAVDVLLHRSRPEFFHQALRITNRAGSALQNRRGNSLGFAFELAGWDHAVDQADFTGTLRVEQLGSQEKFSEITFADLEGAKARLRIQEEADVGPLIEAKRKKLREARTELERKRA